jgi:hypothetical protein
MNIFRIFLIASWLAVVALTVHAIGAQGMAAGDIFMGDLLIVGWRSQFNADFVVHLCLLALWVAWRERFRPAGLLLAALCILGGGVFSLAYLLVASLRCRGMCTACCLAARRKHRRAGQA